MKSDAEPADPGRTQWVTNQHKWTRGWRRIVLSAVPLAYLVFVITAIGKYSSGGAAVAGYVILASFCLCYFVTVSQCQDQSGPRVWILFGLLAALAGAELPFAHAAAFVMCVFITILAVELLGARSAPIVLALALASLLVPVAIPAWHDSLSTSFSTVTPLAIPIVALVTFAVDQVVEGNRALAEAQTELARLAAENERFRIARDLHDLLGHSLTTITVKAGLARRLGQTDPEGAIREIAQVEALARRSLTEVRAVVTNYRDVTLAGELATGRELLRSAGIAADLPRAVDVVDPTHQELFGWVVREGLTNTVRHARAHSCAVRLSESSIEIVDDGVGGLSRPGNGLSGLRERVAAAGGVVDAGPRQPRGWRLLVSLEPNLNGS